jgi:16S rRNA processing protein RimM
MPAAPRLVVVAEIAGAFGVRGEVKLRSFTANPAACLGYGPLLDQAGGVLLTPVRGRPHGELIVVEAREVRTREDWEALKGAALHVPRSALPEPDEDEVYVADLIGCAVEHVDGRALGVVRAVHNFGADDLLEVAGEAGACFLPFTRAAAPEVDLAGRRVRVDPDEALLPEPLQRQPDEG